MAKTKNMTAGPKPGAWLIRPEWLDRIKTAISDDTARVQSSLTQPDTESPSNTVGDIAVINIVGQISRYVADAWCYGGVSVEEVGQSLNDAVADDSIGGILLRINSPGGNADGIAELAGSIRAASARKPVVAYIDGDACSGAYWLAAAASRIVINEIGWAGSIGAYMLFYDFTKALSDAGIKEIVVLSSQSPNKNPDPGTDSGHAQYQAQVDALAGVFVESVATYRGVTPQTVLDKFGQGSVFMGRQAVDAGLADEVGTFESALASVGTDISIALSRRISMLTLEQIRAENPDAAKALVDEGYKAGCTAERARIEEIDSLGLAGEDLALAVEAKKDGVSTAADVAVKALSAQRERRVKLARDRATDAAPLVEAAGAAAEAPVPTEADQAREEGKKIAAAGAAKGVRK